MAASHDRTTTAALCEKVAIKQPRAGNLDPGRWPFCRCLLRPASRPAMRNIQATEVRFPLPVQGPVATPKREPLAPAVVSAWLWVVESFPWSPENQGRRLRRPRRIFPCRWAARSTPRRTRQVRKAGICADGIVPAQVSGCGGMR